MPGGGLAANSEWASAGSEGAPLRDPTRRSASTERAPVGTMILGWRQAFGSRAARPFPDAFARLVTRETASALTSMTGAGATLRRWRRAGHDRRDVKGWPTWRLRLSSLSAQYASRRDRPPAAAKVPGALTPRNRSHLPPASRRRSYAV